MALYLGSKKVAVTNTVEKQITSMKAFFEAGGKCAQSLASSFEGCWKYDDTANVTDMSSMFINCSNLTTVPLFDTSKVENMNSMFNYCFKLTTVPLFDTSKVTNMSYMFNSCSNLTTVPLFDTSKVENMNSMFYYCSSLTTVPRFDASNVTNLNSMFNSCKKLEAIHMVNINAQLDIHYSTKFTREALLEIIGNLKAQTSGTKTLKMGSTNLDKLTDEDKAIATNKGWTLA
jgi:surface protein